MDKCKVRAQNNVPYDIEVERNQQQSVDEGHSPWKLDPAFVAQVFANLLLYPEGIEGEYDIPYEDIKLIKNNRLEAVARIINNKTIAKYVYMERLVRHNDSGIWTVIGYDTERK